MDDPFRIPGEARRAVGLARHAARRVAGWVDVDEVVLAARAGRGTQVLRLTIGGAPAFQSGGLADTSRYPLVVDVGRPVSYQVLEKGTPVYSADGEKIGTLGHVLAAEHEDVFDGIVISEHMGSRGHRFADADQIGQIGEHGVILKLDRVGCQALPEPSANPAVMYDDPAESRSEARMDKLRRAWDYISGNY